MEQRTVYLDNNATTPIAPEVVQSMVDAAQHYGNASSMHTFGRIASGAIEASRLSIAELIEADPKEIIFTSGASESNNTVFAIARELINQHPERNRILTTAIEHPSITETVKWLLKHHYIVETIPVDHYGQVKMDVFEQMLGDDVVLVSVMSGNNETGTIQPIDAISSLAKAYGILVHTDATQSVGKIPVLAHSWNVDYLSISAHKFYGPKGIGALYVKTGAPFYPFIHGGHQENGRRAGTYDTQAIVGMGTAAKLALEHRQADHDRLWALREKLRKGIETSIPEVEVNGHPIDCLPGTLNISFPRAEGESILLLLDMEGIAVSTGSACATGSLEPSYVLLAAGLDVELAHGSIRFSFGRYSKDEDVDYVLEKLPPIIERLRGMSTR